MGIDLGTTNSLIGLFLKDKISLIPNERGKWSTPSIVAFRAGEVLIGETAKNQSVINPSGTVSQVKRMMGTDHVYNIQGKAYSPSQVSSQILTYLRKCAETYLDEKIESAVITVPAYFSEPQRRDTLKAAEFAGLTTSRLINEPTSAALAWAFEKRLEEGTFIVYDLGGGTFDVSLVRVRGDDYRVLATAGDTRLGGLDFDQMIYSRALEHFEKEIGTITDPSLLQQIRLLSEVCKIDLSTQKSSVLSLPFAGNKSSTHLQFSLTREEWESLLKPWVEKTLRLCDQVLDSAEILKPQLTDLVFSGGSTRIPLIKKRVEEWAGMRIAAGFNPEEAVCRGAAQFASLKTQGRKEKIYDVTAFDLGVEIEGGDFFPLMGANSPLPANVTRQFTTVADEQAIVEIHVQQRHSTDVSSLGKFILGGIQPQTKGIPRINVRFSLNQDGILSVQAQDTASGASQELMIKNLPAAGHGHGPSWEDLERLIQAGSEISWERMPLSQLKWKKDWVTFLTEAKSVFLRKETAQLESSIFALEGLLGELRLSPAATNV